MGEGFVLMPERGNFPADRKTSPYRRPLILKGVRLSLNNLKPDSDVLNIPLFMADHTDRLIGLALDQRNSAPLNNHPA